MHALLTLVDRNKDGHVDKHETTTLFKSCETQKYEHQARGTFQTEKENEFPTNNFFHEEEVDAGDQGISSPAPVTGKKKRKKKRHLVDEEIQVEAVVRLMEKKGRNLQKLMLALKERSSNNSVELGYLMILLESYLGDEEQRILIRKVLRKDGRIDLISLEDYFRKYSSNKKPPTLSGTF